MEFITDVSVVIDGAAYHHPEKLVKLLQPYGPEKQGSCYKVRGTYEELEDLLVQLSAGRRLSSPAAPRPAPLQAAQAPPHVQPLLVSASVMAYIQQRCAEQLKRVGGRRFLIGTQPDPGPGLRPSSTEQVTFRARQPPADPVHADFVRQRFITFYQRTASDLQVSSVPASPREHKDLQRRFPQLLFRPDHHNHQVTVTGPFAFVAKFKEFILQSSRKNLPDEVRAETPGGSRTSDPSAPHGGSRTSGPPAPHGGSRTSGPPAPHGGSRTSGPPAPHGGSRTSGPSAPHGGSRTSGPPAPHGGSRTSGPPAPHGGAPEDEACPICMEALVTSETESLQCSHSFCRGCLRKAFAYKPVCPTCGAVYGALRGTQPDGGTMKVSKDSSSLPGYENYGTIVIHYNIPSGIQKEEHPNPGQPYGGASRTAYLPDSSEGRLTLSLLQRAFQQRLVFTVGRSTTSGRNNMVTWNDIHHKTSTRGGPTHYGYPDPDYLSRVRDELMVKGIK